MMKGLVGSVIFCDIKKISTRQQELFRKEAEERGLPKPKFIIDNVRKVIPTLPRIDIFYYRGDSPGEGGSGIFMLGKKWLSRILEHFPEKNGLIITDGNNCNKKQFRRMIQPGGYYWSSMGWKFTRLLPTPNPEIGGLYVLNVERVVAEEVLGSSS